MALPAVHLHPLRCDAVMSGILAIHSEDMTYRRNIAYAGPEMFDYGTLPVHFLDTRRTHREPYVLVTRLVKLAFAAILVWATYTVTEKGINSSSASLKAAAAAIAISAALQFIAIANDWLSSNIAPVKRRVEQVLHNRLSALYRTEILTGDPSVISMHVWEVPVLYRKIFPYGFRQRLRMIFPNRLHRLAWRPRLVRIGEGGMRRLPPSGVSFRKGYGLVGIALQDNELDNIYWINFNDPSMQEALDQGVAYWQHAPKELTQNLRFTAAARFANRYSEALALVIQDSDTGEAIGVLTFEAKAGANSDLRSNLSLHSDLRSTADLLSPIIARSK